MTVGCAHTGERDELLAGVVGGGCWFRAVLVQILNSDNGSNQKR